MGAGDYAAGVGPAGADPVNDPSAATRKLDNGALKFDGATRDLVLADDGVFEQIHYVDQKVALRLLVDKGSIAGDPAFGSTLTRIGRGSTSQLVRRAEDAVNVALSDMLSAKEIELVDVAVETPFRGKLLVVVRYRNLLLANEQQRTISVST